MNEVDEGPGVLGTSVLDGEVEAAQAGEFLEVRGLDAGGSGAAEDEELWRVLELLEQAHLHGAVGADVQRIAVVVAAERRRSRAQGERRRRRGRAGRRGPSDAGPAWPPRPQGRRDGMPSIDDSRVRRDPATIPRVSGSEPGARRGRTRAHTWPGRPGPLRVPAAPLEARQGNVRKVRPVRLLLESARGRKRPAGRPLGPVCQPLPRLRATRRVRFLHQLGIGPTLPTHDGEASLLGKVSPWSR